jgi:UDP-N-acetylmuramoyl-tripeptide--D-alanyl-D-alanine ligase
MYWLKKIASWLGKECDRHLPIAGCAIDSREVEKGGLFFALKGEKVDGHDFLKEVAFLGAFAAVVDKGYKGPDFGMVLFHVDDVVFSMQEIARRALEERRTRIIGITGSIGKTTTKEFLYEILKFKFRVGKTFGNRNSQRTLPLAILNAKGDEEFLILEMSMTEKGNIEKLAFMAPPEIIILGPIVACHSRNFQSVEKIAEAKMEIFTEIAEFAVIHEISAKFDAVAEGCVCDHTIYPQSLGFDFPFLESHLNENVSAAVEVGRYLGLTIEEMHLSSKRLKPFEHRFQKKLVRGITFIDDAYNANATSMIAAIQNLPKPKDGGKTIAVLGSMADLGKYSFASHTEVAKIAIDKIDILYCIGDEAKPMVEVFEKSKKPVRFFISYDELKQAVHHTANEGDVVLVKGSNFHKLWSVIH